MKTLKELLQRKFELESLMQYTNVDLTYVRKEHSEILKQIQQHARKEGK
jgi:hypothetical protein